MLRARFGSRAPPLGRVGQQGRREGSNLPVDLPDHVVDCTDRVILDEPHLLGRPPQQLALFQGLERQVGVALWMSSTVVAPLSMASCTNLPNSFPSLLASLVMATCLPKPIGATIVPFGDADGRLRRLIAGNDNAVRSRARRDRQIACAERRRMKRASTAQPREARWSPSGIVASGTRGEHARWPIGVADEPPRFASESLIEGMGMADLGRNRRPAMCTEGTKGAVAFSPKGTTHSRHRRTSLPFPLASVPTVWRIPRLPPSLRGRARLTLMLRHALLVATCQTMDRRGNNIRSPRRGRKSNTVSPTYPAITSGAKRMPNSSRRLPRRLIILSRSGE